MAKVRTWCFILRFLGTQTFKIPQTKHCTCQKYVLIYRSDLYNLQAKEIQVYKLKGETDLL